MIPPFYITYFQLKNWRNFTSAQATLPMRVFLVGPNASGKSNLLDLFRFLRSNSRSARYRAVNWHSSEWKARLSECGAMLERFFWRVRGHFREQLSP
ncbi:MAG: AAA family ATPase, partial [Deltaproteobacteria bacterium]|nr:AAA family ATPase [Deltaproteobacteria bacterium]